MNNKNYFLIIFICLIIVVLLLNFAIATTENKTSNTKVKLKVSAERIFSDCYLWEECPVSILINSNQNLGEIFVSEKIPKGWQIVSSNPDYSSYNLAEGRVEWRITEDNLKNKIISYSVIPSSNKKGKFSGFWMSENKKRGSIKGDNILRVKNDSAPLSINITSPVNASNITTSSVYVTARTNRKAVCLYSLIGSTTFPGGGGGGGSIPRLMNATNSTVHSQSIINLKNNYQYKIILNCTDILGNFNKSSIGFFVGF